MILVIDNYDSFTYNLVQLMRGLGEGSWNELGEVEVVRNDVESTDQLLAREPRAIVLSPGPCRPEDAGHCLDLLARRPQIPLLGVCLGHQSLGQSFGAKVVPSPSLMHGKTSPVRHLDRGAFEGLPNPFIATRYHSLEVPEDSLPPELEALAWADDGSLMGMQHRELPYWGVQFHPESVLTPSGTQLMKNFLSFAVSATSAPATSAPATSAS
ncbi:MAG: aminodeoxychorismate/anthranilate synthase component II [Acidobacteriota bacterium]